MADDTDGFDDEGTLEPEDYRGSADPTGVDPTRSRSDRRRSDG